MDFAFLGLFDSFLIRKGRKLLNFLEVVNRENIFHMRNISHAMNILPGYSSRKNEAELTTVARVQCSKAPSWNYERQDDEEHDSGPDERTIVKGASINIRSFTSGKTSEA